jgi:carbamoyltransferase
VAPMVLEEDVGAVFDGSCSSPYMSMSCEVRAEVQASGALPAATHYDGSARPQTVAAHQEPYIHTMLTALKRATGYGVVINTSFNTKGKPIVNRAIEVLDMLRDDSELDAVIIDEWLFTKQSVLAA